MRINTMDTAASRLLWAAGAWYQRPLALTAAATTHERLARRLYVEALVATLRSLDPDRFCRHGLERVHDRR